MFHTENPNVVGCGSMPHLPHSWGRTTLRCLFEAVSLRSPDAQGVNFLLVPPAGLLPFLSHVPTPSALPGVTSSITKSLSWGLVSWGLQTTTTLLCILLLETILQLTTQDRRAWPSVPGLLQACFMGQALTAPHSPLSFSPAPGFFLHLGQPWRWELRVVCWW